MTVTIEANSDVLLQCMSNIATIHCCPFKDNNAHLQFSLKMNNVKLAEFSEPVFQLSLASLKCLGILVFVV